MIDFTDCEPKDGSKLKSQVEQAEDQAETARMFNQNWRDGETKEERQVRTKLY